MLIDKALLPPRFRAMLSTPPTGCIRLRGVRQNNLKGFDLDLPTGQLIVVTGLSGSGKSSLAFDTLYAEGQRRYVETFSPYARQFFERMDKPRVDSIEGIPPAIAIEQRNAVRTTRSTVGTMTELCDYMKALWPHIARPHCPQCGKEVRRDDPASIWNNVRENWADAEVCVLFEVPLANGIGLEESLGWVQKQGYQRLWLNGRIIRLEQLDSHTASGPTLEKLVLVQDRIRLTGTQRTRFVEACEQAFHLGRGKLSVARIEAKDSGAQVFSRALECGECARKLPEASSSLFSFNHPHGACPNCKGFGRVITIDYGRALPDHSLTLRQGVVKPWQSGHGTESQRDLMKFCKLRGVPVDIPFQELPETLRRWVVEGDPGYGQDEAHQWPKSWYGVKGYFRWLETKSYKMHYRVFLARYRAYDTCPACQGQRFQPDALLYRFLPASGVQANQSLTLADFYRLTIRQALDVVRGMFPHEPKHLLSPSLSLSSIPNGGEGGQRKGEEPLRASGVHGANLEAAKFLPEGLSRAAAESLRTVWKEVEARLGFLDEVGLGYLTLDRPTKTLSGGETERVNLTSCLGASLVNTLFVLDEPSVGLHTRDTARLVGVLRRLRDAGNTVVVVEHEAEVMRAANHLVDLGPGRGESGGQVVFQGSWTELLSDSKTLTGAYLAGRAQVGGGRNRNLSSPGPALKVFVPQCHNLRDLRVRIPLGGLVCVTGVSGSGKTTLVKEVLLSLLQEKFAASPGAGKGTAESDESSDTENEAGLEKVGELRGWESLTGVVLVDQTPLAKTPRSNPGGYVGAWDEIRKLFAACDDAKREELQSGCFSFNSRLGQCERCRGAGFEKVEMQFLSDLFIRCPACEGKRFRPHVLKARVRPSSSGPGWNVADILEATVDDAIRFLERFEGRGPAANAVKRLRILQTIGLGYLRVGQPLNTLSGGESQRLKLVGHLADAVEQVTPRMSSPAGGGTPIQRLIFLLDEPTTGLHFDDVRLLLSALQQLVDAGHSLVVVEHHLDVIRAADWIIDLGPEAGAEGGRIVIEGPPGVVEACDQSFTGRALRDESIRTPPGSAGISNAIRASESGGELVVRGAREHNLKNFDLAMPRNQFVVVTGISGSGKSTLAFDLIFNEGQRRFLDCMSAYARQFVEQMARPDVDAILGLPPTVSIEQRNTRGGAKSTVATVTEIYHFIRLLFARLGEIQCPQCGIEVGSQTRDQVAEGLRLESKKRGALRLLAPVVRHRKGFHSDVIQWAAAKGYDEVRVDGKVVSTEGRVSLSRFNEHNIEIVTGMWPAGGRANSAPLRDLVERTLDLGGGTLLALDGERKTTVHSTERACGNCGRSFEKLDPKHFSYHSPQGWCPRCRGFGELFYLPDADRGARADAIEESWFMWQEGKREPCPDCSGTRLQEVARAVRLSFNGAVGRSRGARRHLTVPQLAAMPVVSALELFREMKFQGEAAQVARDIIPEVRERLKFMSEVGLGYLQLGRGAMTLSGGESQRIRLAAQLGSNLSGVLYVLDEPTIGLHARDNEQLLEALARLRSRGNSLLVVEHDEETMRQASHVIDLGPGAGERGGMIVAQGTLADLERNEDSVTGRCLREKRQIPGRGSRRPVEPPAGFIPARRGPRTSSSALELRELQAGYGLKNPAGNGPATQSGDWLVLHGAKVNNLKGLDVSFPIGRLITVTGVSGSGKSTLIKECLLPSLCAALDRKSKATTTHSRITGHERIKAAYEVDQSPIGRTPRSTPATYVGFFDEIRKLFALAPEARMRGYGPGRFSFNSVSGRCAVCEGAGQIKLEMNFLPPAFVRCEACGGLRFTRETLDVRWQGKTIAEVLDLSVAEAVEYFDAHRRIRRPLEALADTGLGYLRLGQTSPTLSGGEAQRVKLVTHLLGGLKPEGVVNRDARGSLFALEEPTIGLHMLDVRKLVEVLQRLVDSGHTVIVIEHNLDLIAESDWVIDLGPEGGEDGGRIVAQGTPEEVSEVKESHTGRFLKKFFAAHRKRRLSTDRRS